MYLIELFAYVDESVLNPQISQITPVRFSEPTPVPSTGATGQAGRARITPVKYASLSLSGISRGKPRYDFPNLPQYHLPELRGRRGEHGLL